MGMKSIRSRLNFWLLSGSILLWLAAGTVIYFAVRHSLLKSLDAELALDARLVRFAARGDEPEIRTGGGGGGRGFQDRLPAYEVVGGYAVFQVWNFQGETVDKSASLGDDELVFPTSEIGKEPKFAERRSAAGREFRTMAFRLAPGKRSVRGPGRRGPGPGPANTIVIGRDLSQLRETMGSVLWGIAMVGVGVAVGAVLLVRLVVALVLKPLRALGRETQNVDAGTLHARFDADGAPVELVPIYAQLNDLISRLETSFDRERRFNADLAHEMRTPLAELKMLNEVALKWEDQAGEETHQQTLEIASQLESIIETLLALARYESGEFVPDLRLLNLQELVEECWASYAKAAAEKQLQVELEFEGDPPMIQADRELLLRVLNNLFSNVVEYSPGHGSISVLARNDGLVVSNPAPELGEPDLENLFDRYWRQDLSRSESKHVGLGLSLAKVCAEACGLEITASLDEGRLSFEVSAKE